MREITDREVEAVGGAWGLPGAGVGALSGAAGYLGYAATSGNFSWYDLGYNVVLGGATGAVSGPVGAARAYFLPRVAGSVGAIGGRMDARWNM